MSPIIKRPDERIKIPTKYYLFFLSIICASMILVTFSTDVSKGPINNIAGGMVIPFEKGISSIGQYLHDRKEEIVNVKNLLQENAQLKEQIDELTIENTTLQQERYELTNLRELYKLDQTYSEYDKIGARIIAKESGNWFHSFIIDKGEADGIKVDMNVMAGSGLVGRVTQVGEHWARVISIIADNSNVSAMVISTSDTMIVSGDLELYSDGLISFSQLIDNANKVNEGDKIVTSNISNKYLPGILIGYISTINKDANNLTKSGYITPAVDFEHIDQVLVITQLKQTAD